MAKTSENTELGTAIIGGGFLGALSTDLRKMLATGADLVTYQRHTALLRQGAALRAGVVVNGLVRAYVTADDGREATVRYVRPGEAFGLADMFVADPALGLQALTETTVLYFDEALVSRTMASDVEFVRAIAGHLAGRSRISSESFRSFAFGRVRQRVAAHLLSLATRDEKGWLVARVTQQGVADAVGSVRDVVARELRDLSRAGLVVTSHGKIVVTDEDGLQEEAFPW
jgi:CRP/FNR family cyclic AMP-dependent transcriptional regulator